VQDEVEPFVIKLLSGGFAYAIGGAGDERIRRRALEVLLPAVRRSEEVEPHEIEDGPQFRETNDEADVVDGGVGHGERSAEGERPPWAFMDVCIPTIFATRSIENRQLAPRDTQPRISTNAAMTKAKLGSIDRPDWGPQKPGGAPIECPRWRCGRRVQATWVGFDTADPRFASDHNKLQDNANPQNAVDHGADVEKTAE